LVRVMALSAGLEDRVYLVRVMALSAGLENRFMNQYYA
jgi:hypothetical protein